MEKWAIGLNDYEYDFIYYLSYLKYNSSNLYFINVKKLYNKNKNDVCNAKSKFDFFNKLQSFYFNNLWLNGLYGHNSPFELFDRNYFKYNVKCYDNIINQMIKLKKPYDNDMKQYNDMIKIWKEENIIYEEKLYNTSIIKNDKNEDVIMIKIKSFINLPTIKEYNELYKFLSKNIHLKDLYIDIRGNTGGNSNCYTLLYNLILNETLEYKYDNIKCYFKKTKFTKPFIDYKLGNCKKDIKKAKRPNKHYTHYIIQRVKNEKYPDWSNPEIKKYKKKNLNYKGNIFIIMDHFNFSSAQMMLDISKGSKRIKILGNEKSSGSGYYGSVYCGKNGYQDPTYFILPKSKILCQMDLFDYNHKKYLTTPDDKIPKWIK